MVRRPRVRVPPVPPLVAVMLAALLLFVVDSRPPVAAMTGIGEGGAVPP
jgi:hypothetical protein